MSVPIRRQAHGIKAKSITITLPSSELSEVKAEAARKGVTPSRHIVDLIRFARATCAHLNTIADTAPAEPATAGAS